MKNERQIAAIPAHVEYEAKERQLQLEVELEKQANRIQALETQVDALRAQIALDRRGYKRFTQAVRHALDRLPGGSRLIGLYSAWKAPSLSDFAVSADVPEAIANLAADRTATLFSDWHVGSVRAAKQVADDGELVDISISVVLYNSSQWIESFTSSLLRSNYPQDKISVVFVDNGSTDDTVDKVTSWIQNFGTDFSGVTLLRRKNDGYGAGNDSAIALCKTEFVLVTNVDVDFDPDLLRRIVAAAVSDSADVGCWEAMQTPYQHPKYHDPVTLLTNWCSHACVLFRKSAYISAGGYEKRLFMYGEDVELSYRLRAAGWRLRYVPFARLVHHNDISDQKLRPLQLSGSLAANVLLRHRYGRPMDAFVGEALLRALKATTHDRQRLQAVEAAVRTVRKHRRAFMATRKRRNSFFPFSGFDYDIIRDGAMFRHKAELSLKGSPTVSVITRTMEGRNWLLREAISSVLNQTYPNIQHIIVEDKGESAEGLVEQVKKVYRSDIVYCRSTKGGRTAAGNAGLAAAKGDLIIFLDDDDLFFPDHIETLVQTIEKFPRSICAYSLAWMVRTDIDMAGQSYRELSHDVVASHRLPFDRSRLLIENIAPIQSVLFRRRAYEQCGGFHEDMDLLEDWNMWCRFSALGSFAFCEKLTSLYRVPADLAAVSSRQRGFDESYGEVCARNLDDLSRQMLVAEGLSDVSPASIEYRS